MAAPPSRLERLVQFIGEENLPPKLPTITVAPVEDIAEMQKIEAPTDSIDSLQKVDDFIQEQEEPSNNWWDAVPTVPRLVKQSKPHQPQPAQTPMAHHSGGFEFDESCGEKAPLGLSFAPFLAVTKLPYKFVQKQFMQPIASAFFDDNKIYNRGWDIYYVWSDYYQTAKPVTFIPEHQLLALVEEINQQFPKAKVNIGDELRESGMVINFDDCSSLRPRWLGHSTSRPQYTSWTEDLTMPKQGEITDERTLQVFREKMELATEIAKNKSKATKARKQTEHIANRQTMVRSLLRAQRYLGMLAKTEESLLPDIAAMTISPIDYTMTSQFPFDQDVVFIAIDVEAYERPPRMITEVGVATLDTRDLIKHAPGKVGEDWQKFIRARHFRVSEYKHLVNSEFVSGCPDKFEFGKSEFVRKDSISKEVFNCFKPPYSSSESGDADEKRQVVLVGHDVSQDINYLQSIGVNILTTGNIVDKIDTAEMFRVQTRDPNPRSLGGVLYDFDLMGWHLHNAGNDAVYTIWAMLAICVKAASDRGSEEQRKKHDENMQKRTETAVEQAKQRVQDGSEGWETAENDDGGVALGLK